MSDQLALLIEKIEDDINELEEISVYNHDEYADEVDIIRHILDEVRHKARMVEAN